MERLELLRRLGRMPADQQKQLPAHLKRIAEGEDKERPDTDPEVSRNCGKTDMSGK